MSSCLSGSLHRRQLVEAILGDVHPCVKKAALCAHGIQKLPAPFPFGARPCGYGLPSCYTTRGPGNCSGSALKKGGHDDLSTSFDFFAIFFWWTRAGLSCPPGRFYDCKQDTRAGVRDRYAALATSAGIVVEPTSGLDAETPLVGVLAQELTGAFRDAVAHGGVVLLDVEHYVEADAIHEAKRRHAGAGPDLPHGVDVLGRRDALLDHHQGLALDRRPDAVEDEPVALVPYAEGHQPVLRDLLHERVDDPVVGLAARHELDRVEFGRLLVVGVQHALGVLDLADHLAGRQRGRVAAQDRVGLGKPVQVTEDLGLDVDPLGHRLDHHPATGDGLLQVVGDLDPSAPGGV